MEILVSNKITSNTHLNNIREISTNNSILLIDAVQHYVEYNGLDPYFVADIVHTDKEFLSEIQKEAKSHNLLK
tara:strand:+ start:282 stop:500 length:219 start_codon:yes stop_codon:yes gene_type:complete